MRILFVSNYVPIEPKKAVQGVFRRMRMFADALNAIAEIDFLFYVPAAQDTPENRSAVESGLQQDWGVTGHVQFCSRSDVNPATNKWKTYWNNVRSFYRQGVYNFASGPEQLSAFDRCLARGPNAVFAHRLGAMCPVLLSKRDVPPVVFDLDDIEHVQLFRKARAESHPPDKIMSYLCLPALLWGERRAIRCASATCVCSDIDRDYLQKLRYGPRIITIPNSVEIPEEEPAVEAPTLLFFASYLFDPNVEAAQFMLKEVWPLVREKVPQARLVIAGNNPENIPCYTEQPAGVTFPGLITDLHPLYREAKIVCAPVLRGAGTRVKIVEAAAYAKPIVATRLAAEGLEMADGVEVLLRDEARGFAEACVSLLKDDTYCERLGRSARSMAMRCFDRKKTMELIRAHFVRIARGDATRVAPGKSMVRETTHG